MSEHYDVIVIGGGPAGYPAAIRAAQNGLSAACIDAWENPGGARAFGGTCLNAGCIPSKALLESSEIYYRAKTEFASHGVQLEGVSLDLDAMQQRKQKIVKQLTGGIESLFKANKVTGLFGHGRLLGGNQVEFTPAEGEVRVLSAGNVIIATGSEPIELSVAPFDGRAIVDSWGALDFDTVPQRVGVIGGGVIGMELGSVWHRLGSKVTILEALPDFLAMADQQIAKDALRQFQRQGLDVRLDAKVTATEKGPAGVSVSFDHAGETQSIEVDKLIVCVGRRPYTDGLIADGLGLALDGRGFIEVDDQCRTNLANVWAVGDVVRGPMLAHKGTEEGVMAADLIAGQSSEVNYDVIPSVIYTDPEIAWVGLTEEQVKASGRAYKIGTFPFSASGRAKAMEHAGGLVKMIAAEDDDEILGVHVVGPLAGELIAEAVVAMEFSACAEDIQRTVHAHPTLTEALHEAALAVDKRALHMLNR